MITSLTEKQIFIFGSNFAGKHIGGAAKQALNQFGATEGMGSGLSGQSYAFPTLDENFKKLSHSDLKRSVQRLYDCCKEKSDKEFLLTPVGTGIAGYRHEYMKNLFINPPQNLVLPDEWK